MSSRSTLVSEIQQLLTGENADPRAAQGVFLIPLIVEFVLHVVPPSGFDSGVVVPFSVKSHLTDSSPALRQSMCALQLSPLPWVMSP